MNTNTISDYDIQALIDNELDYEDAKQVQTYIEQNRHAQKRYSELIAQKNLLKLWWKSNLQ